MRLTHFHEITDKIRQDTSAWNEKNGRGDARINTSPNLHLARLGMIDPSTTHINKETVGEQEASKGYMIAIAGGALLEAFTEQIDNICVPIYTYALMRLLTRRH